MAEEYDEAGYYEVSMHNKADVHIQVHKADKLNPTKYINGAKYGIYNDKGKLLEELVTSTVKKGSITYDGFAESEDTYPLVTIIFKKLKHRMVTCLILQNMNLPLMQKT